MAATRTSRGGRLGGSSPARALPAGLARRGWRSPVGGCLSYGDVLGSDAQVSGAVGELTYLFGLGCFT